MNYELLKKNFEAHGFLTEYFDTISQVQEYLKEQIQDTSVAIGGSMTCKELDADKILAEKNQVYWHWLKPGRETLMAARDAKVYILSANGVSETGELVNIDGTGNRVSMTLFGPEKVIFIVGRNKIEPDLHHAIHRAKNVAAPKNAVRLSSKTPCAANNGDKCYDCKGPHRICRGTAILERPVNGMEVEILFVNEDLGY